MTSFICPVHKNIKSKKPRVCWQVIESKIICLRCGEENPEEDMCTHIGCGGVVTTKHSHCDRDLVKT